MYRLKYSEIAKEGRKALGEHLDKIPGFNMSKMSLSISMHEFISNLEAIEKAMEEKETKDV